jgi:hypothetical protein
MINRNHVAYAWTGYTGYLPKDPRKPRPQATTPSTVTLTHTPTGVIVKGHISRRRYSRRAMQDQLIKLRKRLHVELEKAVAQQLRSSRR